MKIKTLFFVLSIMFVCFFTGCAHYNFRIVVQDKDDNPVPDAIVYVESYTPQGAVDFAWVRAGDSIKVPPEDKGPISLHGSYETYVALAIFAEGKKPVVIIDPSGKLKPEVWEYMLEDEAHEGPVWEPQLAKLHFPFQHRYDLNHRLRQKENIPLIQAFIKAYKPLDQKIVQQQALASEIEKYNFLTDKVFIPLSDAVIEAQPDSSAAKGHP